MDPARDQLAGGRRIGQQLGIPFAERDLRPADVAAADEVLLTSTPSCLLPVTRFEDRPIRDGKPGPVFTRLLTAWKRKSELILQASP